MSEGRSISDDDLCSDCAHLGYNPGYQSFCKKDWPGKLNPDGYCVECPLFEQVKEPEANFTKQARDEADGVTYKIVRKFFNGQDDEVIETGLTLRQAQAHCSDPETSSKTAKRASSVAITSKMGPWFDAYYEE